MPNGNDQKSESRGSFYNVKDEEKRGVTFDTSWMDNAKKRMEAMKQDEEELTGVKEGDIFNLPDLLFTENRDYLSKKQWPKGMYHYGGMSLQVLLYFLLIIMSIKLSCFYAMNKRQTTPTTRYETGTKLAFL